MTGRCPILGLLALLLLAAPTLAQEAGQRKAAVNSEKAECERKGGPRIGMNRSQVYATCWGKPYKINTTMTSGIEFEQFVYGLGFYVYLRNGTVTSIQTSESRPR